MIRAARTIFSLVIISLYTSTSDTKVLPGLSNVDHIDSIRASLPEVRFHVDLHVFRAQMALSCQKHLNVLGRSIEDRGKI